MENKQEFEIMKIDDKIKSEVKNDNEIYVYKNIKVFNYKAIDLHTGKVYYFKRYSHIIKYLRLNNKPNRNQKTQRRISRKITKAINNNKSYDGYNWFKLKDEEKINIINKIYFCEKGKENYKAICLKNNVEYYFEDVQTAIIKLKLLRNKKISNPPKIIYMDIATALLSDNEYAGYKWYVV